MKAQVGILNVGYIKVAKLKKYTREELDKIILHYEKVLETVKTPNSRTLSIVLEYAELLSIIMETERKH